MVAETRKKTHRLGKGFEYFFDRSSEEEIFNTGLRFDESGNYLFAFYYYMRTYYLNGPYKLKGANNAAVILAEHGFVEEAIRLLEDALSNVDKPEKYEGFVEVCQNLRALRGENGGR